MEEMDDLYAKLQVYLMKKDAECGKLKFLTSRTTVQNSNDVQAICDSISEILSSCDIPIKENASTRDSRCVRAFKYLTLNTCFEAQENLTEDPVNGHLVDMCPPLSPYLLAEILWSLGYEEILAESVLHVPLDLAIELIEISRRCLNLLNFSRGHNFLSLLALNCYKSLRLIDAKGAITRKPDESLESLTINCQELLALFLDEKFMRIGEIGDIQKSERKGLILRSFIELSRVCLSSVDDDKNFSFEASIYKLTFGRESTRRIDENLFARLAMLDQEFVNILLKKLTDIDVKTYLDWASLEDRGNPTLSLQKSIGIDCYEFSEFIKNRENLIKLDKLVECLRQISCKPDASDAAPSSELDLDGLRERALAGKIDCLKELMKRYREWNHEIFHSIRDMHKSLDRDDFFNLLEYLAHVMTKDGQEEHKRDVYAVVTRVLLRQDIKSVYETIVNYILKHDARNILESSYTEDVFKNFMSRNTNFKSSTNLRLVLFFLAKNPRKILTILVKMTIGHAEYENTMITPCDLLLLGPIMNIREKPDETLLLGTLRQICHENGEWCAKKFAKFLRIMLDERIFSADDAVNNVFVPFLAESIGQHGNISSILNCLREIVPMCTIKMRFTDLAVVLARKISRIRCDAKLRKYTKSQAIRHISRIIEILIMKFPNRPDNSEKHEFIENMEKSIAPIDKHHFAKLLLSDPMAKIDVYDTMKNYESRCFTVLTRIRNNSRDTSSDNEKIRIPDFQSDRMIEHFMRHLIVESIESEYVKFAIETIILEWDMLGCENEYAAYEKIARLTREACVYCLEFPDENSSDSLASLMKSLARFTRSLMNIEEIRDIEKIDNSLMENFRNLSKTMERTIFATIYTSTLVEINNRDCREPARDKLRGLVLSIDNFGNKCLDICHSSLSLEAEASNEAKRYKIAHDFVTEATSIVDENNLALCQIYELLRTNDSDKITDAS